MKVLVIGSGGREHAIIDSLSQNKTITTMFAAPGNGGIGEVAQLVPIPADNVQALLGFARSESIDLTFVGPEVPLGKGIVDLFQTAGLTIVGPTRDQARLETSKGFAKHFFRENRIPTADFQECSSPEQAYDVLERSKFPLVIKADGLAAGKGVSIAASFEDAVEVIRQVMEQKTLGDAGTKVRSPGGTVESCARSPADYRLTEH